MGLLAENMVFADHDVGSPLDGHSVVDSGLSDRLKERTTLPEKMSKC